MKIYFSPGEIMKVRNVLIFLLIISATLSSVKSAELSKETQHKVKQILYEGAGFLAAKDTPKALARFKSALKLNPENPECFYWIGLAYSDLNNYGQAAKEAKAAISLNPRMSKAWLLWGQSLLFDGKYEEAEEKLQKALRFNRRNYITAFNLGRCYYYGFEGKKKMDALNYFKLARELNPNFITARYYEGLCYLDENMLQLAITSFRIVLQANPQNTDTLIRLGMAYRKNGHIARAEREFTLALQTDPENYEAHLQLGHIYFIEKPNRQKALYHFNKFLRFSPEEHPWRKRIINFLKRDKEREEKLKK